MEPLIELAALLGNLLAALTLPGSILLLVLSVSALRYKQPVPPAMSRQSQSTYQDNRLAILVPAHNEAAQIGQLVDDLMLQIGDDFNTDLWVIADHCTDDTAELAASHGAQVIERKDQAARGKGAALRDSFFKLQSQYYDWYLVVDADSVLDPSFLHHMRMAMRSQAHALQANYEGLSSAQSESGIARLAQTAMNVVRVKGRAALNASVGILGNGFALHRQTLASVPYLADSVVEDLEYHLRLVDSGFKVSYVPEAKIWGDIAGTRSALAGQRARWEGGRLRMVREFLPHALGKLLGRGRLNTWEATLDLTLLPITLQLGLALLGGLLTALTGHWVAFALCALMPLSLSLHLWITLQQPGIQPEGSNLIKHLAGYLLFKLTLLPKVFLSSSKKARWVRTERATDKASSIH